MINCCIEVSINNRGDNWDNEIRDIMFISYGDFFLVGKEGK